MLLTELQTKTAESRRKAREEYDYDGFIETLRSKLIETAERGETSYDVVLSFVEIQRTVSGHQDLEFQAELEQRVKKFVEQEGLTLQGPIIVWG